ncbi:MAG: hypothetical protein R3C99_07720 [Pirellulaceae bacterium]
MEEPPAKSRSERLIDEIKASQMETGQFRLRGLFIVTIAVSVIFALPRVAGADYGEFLAGLYLFAYGLMPIIAWLATFWFPRMQTRHRLTLGVLVGLVVISPWIVMVLIEGDLEDLFALAAITLLFFWGPQWIVIFWLHWRFFRPDHRLKHRRPETLALHDIAPVDAMPDDPPLIQTDEAEQSNTH